MHTCNSFRYLISISGVFLCAYLLDVLNESPNWRLVGVTKKIPINSITGIILRIHWLIAYVHINIITSIPSYTLNWMYKIGSIKLMFIVDNYYFIRKFYFVDNWHPCFSIYFVRLFLSTVHIKCNILSDFRSVERKTNKMTNIMI